MRIRVSNNISRWRTTRSVSFVEADSTHLISLSRISQFNMAKPDPYADIDFDEINEATGLAPDEIKCLKVSKEL